MPAIEASNGATKTNPQGVPVTNGAMGVNQGHLQVLYIGFIGADLQDNADPLAGGDGEQVHEQPA